MPGEWGEVFNVSAHDKSFSWGCLPFGWRYSPVLCRKLVFSITDSVIWRIRVLFFVYLDDILLVGRRRFLRCAVRKLKWKRTKSGFLISPKSVVEPSRSLDFIGKLFDMDTGDLSNRLGL